MTVNFFRGFKGLYKLPLTCVYQSLYGIIFFQYNIIFGKTVDKKKYNKVLDACALLPDLKILPGTMFVSCYWFDDCRAFYDKSLARI